jgi:hypothetical protein
MTPVEPWKFKPSLFVPGLTWQGWDASYWELFFPGSDINVGNVRQRLNDLMQGYIVVDTLLVVMAFPTLFGLLAIPEANQENTVAFKICVFFLATGCLMSLASIVLLASVLAVARLPETIEWSAQLSTSVKHMLVQNGFMTFVALFCYGSAIPTGFFTMMHYRVATAGTAVFASLFISMATWFIHCQYYLLKTLGVKHRPDPNSSCLFVRCECLLLYRSLHERFHT